MEQNQKNEYVQTATSLSCCILLAITSIMAPFYMPLFFGIISMLGTLGAAYFIAVSSENTKNILLQIFKVVKSWFNLSVEVSVDCSDNEQIEEPAKKRSGKRA